MRFRHCEKCIWTQGEPGDLFAESKTVFFQNYKGGESAYIYVPNEGYRTVKRSELSHIEKVPA